MTGKGRETVYQKDLKLRPKKFRLTYVLKVEERKENPRAALNLQPSVILLYLGCDFCTGYLPIANIWSSMYTTYYLNFV